MHDPGAAERLWTAVQRAFVEPGKVRNKHQLHEATGIARPTLDNWLIKGVQPPLSGMRQMAEALGVDPAILWLRWLDLDPPDGGLDRIADEIALLRKALTSEPTSGDPEMEQRLDDAEARHANQSERRRGDRRDSAEG